MEAILRQIASEVEQRPYLMYGEKLAFMVFANQRVEGVRVPPCTFFNVAMCEYKSTMMHHTRAQRSHLAVAERAHICAVCYAQHLVSPHRATECPIVYELDLLLDQEDMKNDK